MQLRRNVEYYAKFQKLQKRCPKYDFFKGSLLHLFYQGLNEYEKRLLDSSARSAFINLSHDVAAGCAKFVFSYKQCDLGQLIAKRAANELQYNSNVIYFFFITFIQYLLIML